MKRVLTLILFVFVVQSCMSQAIRGRWQGELVIKFQKVEMFFDISCNEDNSDCSTEITIPLQNIIKLGATSTKFTNDSIYIEIEQLRASYKGRLVTADSISGTFRQGFYVSDMSLTRGDLPIYNRPQTPQPPFPYEIREVTFQNESDSVTLAGTFTYPSEGENFPAVLLVHGSGIVNRDEEVFFHKPFMVLADYLTRNGIAVLRYDKRGVGESTGDCLNITTHSTAADARCALAYLKTLYNVDKDNIGIIGHSEGGTISFMLAAEDHDISYIVSMAGLIMDVPDHLMKLNTVILEKNKMADSIAKPALVALRKILDFKEKYSDEYIKANKTALVKEAFAEDVKGNVPIGLRFELASVLDAKNNWIKEFTRLKSSDYVRKTTCPILAINGAKDVQVFADDNLSLLDHYIAEGVVNSVSKTIKYENLNHMFQNCDTGEVHEYIDIDETISQEVLEDIYKWIMFVSGLKYVQ